MDALFLLLHLFGGRDAVGLLSGTLEGDNSRLVLGIAYTLSWFSAVLLAPVLLLAELSLRRLSRSAPPGARES
ncbi:hypothetical protein JQX13_07390 [Archangium violaceum]|uniref:hypothetical protein n=1 Tax=Archangium violaceum TaxID=83451 RepID=UPI00193B255D|nr:hypothetical protein [Archangium violaceum]QRK09918.1 hypothetical protein JQX13_07390 [Archangium violaceum]